MLRAWHGCFFEFRKTMNTFVVLNPFRRAILQRLAVPALALMLTACAMGPDYQRPPIDTGLAYKEVLAASPSSSAAVAASQAWVQAPPGDEALSSSSEQRSGGEE